jgi:hypothetical protein
MRRGCAYADLEIIAAGLAPRPARHAGAAVRFQGEQILDQPLIIVILAVPILIQVYFNAGLAYLLNRQLGRAIG